jgi:hypothetical protein
MAITEKMAENERTQESEAIRKESEFIKHVEDFARYMHKEHIEGREKCAMIISAVDDLDDTRKAMLNVVLGNKMLNISAMASMMQRKDLSGMFRQARMESMQDDDVLEEAIKEKRGVLRRLYGMAALTIFWTLCLIGFYFWDVSTLISTISNLLLMGFVGYMLYREITLLRRVVARMEQDLCEERKARVEHFMEKAKQLFGSLIQRLQQDDDDD